jgi:hypothetical protein
MLRVGQSIKWTTATAERPNDYSITGTAGALLVKEDQLRWEKQK